MKEALKNQRKQRIEQVEELEGYIKALERKRFWQEPTKEQPYTYWTMELYEEDCGLKGSGELGLLAADFRRLAEKANLPFVVFSLFYPHQNYSYQDFGFQMLDKINLKIGNKIWLLEVIEREFQNTKIINIFHPELGSLYVEEPNSKKRLIQEIILGFGGFLALKLAGLKPATIHLNEEATVFTAIARLDALVEQGINFYEAIVYIRKNTLYTHHALNLSQEVDFTIEQFQEYVFPILKTQEVKNWLRSQFFDGRIKLSALSIKLAELKTGVNKEQVRILNDYNHKNNFRTITNGIDLDYWIAPKVLDYYHKKNLLDEKQILSKNFQQQITQNFCAQDILALKQKGKEQLEKMLEKRTDYLGEKIKIPKEALIISFRQQLVDFQRPDLPFYDLNWLKEILEKYNAYYILTGLVHPNNQKIRKKIDELLAKIEEERVLRKRIFYIPENSEELIKAVSQASNITIHVPKNSTGMFGTTLMRDLGNLGLLISTTEDETTEIKTENYLEVEGETIQDETEQFYLRLEEAAAAWGNEFDLEYWVRKQLGTFLPIIAGKRMLKEYLEACQNA